MIATLQPTPLDHWRQRFGGRRRGSQPRPLAALSYLANGPVLDGLIEVENLTIIILYDEPVRPGQRAVRLAGFSGSRVPWGVRFGGPENSRFYKDLSLQPVHAARGYRLDLARPELLELGLQLDRELDRCARYQQRPVRKHLRLPKLWAAFRPADDINITGDGPELAAYARRTGRSPQHLLQHLRREHYGLVVYPLAWVSHHWQQSVAVMADLEQFPQRQVFSLRHPSDDLVGFQDATAYDFVHSRFCTGSGRQVRCRRRAATVPA